MKNRGTVDQGRIFAIGDIHGCLSALLRLDKELHFQPSDTVITLGDYVDRGPDTLGVIEYLIELQNSCHLIPLRGNHEEMMLGARKDSGVLQNWLECGGIEVLHSYETMSLKAIPMSHWSFLEKTLRYHEGEHDIFVHANVHSHLPMDEQSDSVLLWERFHAEQVPHCSGKRVICGHTSQRRGVPWNLGHAVCLDTWAYGGGWLTCLDVMTQEYWQASQQGGFRRDSLQS